MGTIALSLPVSNLPNASEDPKIINDFTLIQNVINGNLDGSNVAATAGFVRLVPTTMGSNGTAVAGTLVGAVPGVTVTLPAPAANIAVGVYAGVGVTGANPVTVSGTNIYGVGLSAASSFKLGVPIAAVVLQSDGTNWFVVSGQQDTGWIPLTLNGGTPITAAAGQLTPSARLRGDVASLKGAMISGNSGPSTWATLPAAVRPSVNLSLVLWSSSGGASQCTLQTGGSLVVINGAPGTTISLDGLQYVLA